jgi:TP901 family phage tail tape measure protein
LNNIYLNIVANAQFQQVYAEVTKLKEAMLSLQKSSVGGPFTPANVASIKASQSAFDAAVTSTRAFNIETVAMTSNVEKFGKQLGSGKLSLNQYYSLWRQNAKGTAMELDALATSQARLNRSIAIADPLRPGYAKLITDINGVVTAQEKQLFYQKALNTVIQQGSMKLIDFGKNTQWMGRQLTVGLSMPLAMFGAGVSQAFLQVDKQLTRMQKVYGTGLVQPTQAALKQIRSDVTVLGTDLARTLGTSMQETAAMAADLAATGLEGAKLIGATKEAIRLATLGELDHQQAMQATISLQNVYKLNTQGLSEAVNFLNAVENQTSTSLQDLVDAIPRVGPVVAQLGGSFKDTAAMMVAMKEAGVPAAQGANAIKSALGSLINPTKAAKDAFASVNINIADIAKNAGGKPIAMLKMLADEMKGLDRLAQAQLIEKMFGKFQYARVQALLDNINKMGTQTQTVFGLMGASQTDLANLAAQELKKQTESASGQFKRMVESLKADLLPIGGAFLKAFSQIGMAIDKVIRAVKKFSDMLGPVAKLLGMVFGGGLAGLIVIGPIIMMVGLFANLIGNILRGANSVRMFKQGMDGALPSQNKFMAGLHGMRNFYEELDKSSIAARNQMNLMPEAITSNAMAFEILSQAINTLTQQFRALAEAQALAMGVPAGPMKGSVGAPFKIPFKAPGYAGGIIGLPGSGSGDSIPAMLAPGESVITAKATNQYGPILGAMNNGTLPGFEAGVVGYSPGGTPQYRSSGGSRSINQMVINSNAASKGRTISNDTQVKGWGNATMFLPESMNQSMSGAGVNPAVLAKQVAAQGAATFSPLVIAMAKEMGLTVKQHEPIFKEIAQKFAATTTTAFQQAEGNVVAINDQWVATNLIPKLRETASSIKVAGQDVAMALDATVNNVRTAGVVGVAGGAGGGEGRMAIPGFGSYKSSRTTSQNLAKDWSPDMFKTGQRASGSALSGYKNQFQVLQVEAEQYEQAVMAHLGSGVNMTFAKMKENVATLGGNVDDFVNRFKLRFDTSYREAVKAITRSKSPSQIGYEAGSNMGQGLNKGVLDPRNITNAKVAGMQLAEAEIIGMTTAHNSAADALLDGARSKMGQSVIVGEEIATAINSGAKRRGLGTMARMGIGTGLMMGGSMAGNAIGGTAGSMISQGASMGSMAMMMTSSIPIIGAVTALAAALPLVTSAFKQMADDARISANSLKSSFTLDTVAAQQFGVGFAPIAAYDFSQFTTGIGKHVDSIKANKAAVDALTQAYMNSTDQFVKDDLADTGKKQGKDLLTKMQTSYEAAITNGLDNKSAMQVVTSKMLAAGKTGSDIAYVKNNLKTDLNINQAFTDLLKKAATSKEQNTPGLSGTQRTAVQNKLAQDRAAVANPGISPAEKTKLEKEIKNLESKLLNVGGKDIVLSSGTLTSMGATITQLTTGPIKNFDTAIGALTQKGNKMGNGVNKNSMLFNKLSTDMAKNWKGFDTLAAKYQASGGSVSGISKAIFLLNNDLITQKDVLDSLAGKKGSKSIDQIYKDNYDRIAAAQKAAGVDNGVNGLPGDVGATDYSKQFSPLIKKYEGLIKLVTSQTNAQKKYNDQLKATQDYHQKQMDYFNQMKMATTSGNYLGALAAQQGAKANQGDFKAQMQEAKSSETLQGLQDLLARIQEGQSSGKSLSSFLKGNKIFNTSMDNMDFQKQLLGGVDKKTYTGNTSAIIAKANASVAEGTRAANQGAFQTLVVNVSADNSVVPETFASTVASKVLAAQKTAQAKTNSGNKVGTNGARP